MSSPFRFPFRPLAAALGGLALLAGGLAVPAARAAELTVVGGAPVSLAGGEQACFTLSPSSGDPARVLVRIHFTSAVPAGHVELDGVAGPEFWSAAEEFVFVVQPAGTHRLALRLNAPATIDRLVVENQNGSVGDGDCSRYEEDQRRRVEASQPPPADSINRLGSAPPAQPPPPPAAPQPTYEQPAPAPAAVVPVGTELELRMQGSLSTASAYVGQRFSTELVSDVTGAGGGLALPAGTRVEGTVTKTKDAGRFGRSEMALAFDRAVLADGREVALAGSLQRVGKGSAKKQGGIIAGSAIGGAILGDILDIDPKLGAVVGGAIAAGSIAAKPGESISLPAGTLLGVKLESDAQVPAATPR